VEVRAPVQSYPNHFYFGNAAATVNDANSMNGDNGAGANAIGRTSGSGFH
jgi:hypothetical protein